MQLIGTPATYKPEAGIQVFSFGRDLIRVIKGEDGEPWFVAKDVCEVLGYINPRKAVGDHCKSALSGGVTIRDAIGREQEMTIIPERDVYRLIMRSKLPAAERFEDWVVGEVLPAIRKSGYYSVAHIGRAQLAQMVLEAEADLNLARSQVALLAPKAESFDRFMDGSNVQTMAKAAKSLGTGRNRLFSFLRGRGILMRNNLPYQSYIDRGYFKVIQKSIPMGGDPVNYTQPMVTPKGLHYIRKIMDQVKAEVEA